MKYFKTNKETYERTEITRDEALDIVLGSWKNNQMTFDMLSRPNRIDCMYSIIETQSDDGMVLMAGLWNQILDDVEYDENGNRK